MCSSPRLIAAYHALHRLSMPRHPPCALLRLISCSHLAVRVLRSDRTTGVDSSHPSEPEGPDTPSIRRLSKSTADPAGSAKNSDASQNARECGRLPRTFESGAPLRDITGSTRRSRKEVIQPQVPLRLPCYDFAPVTELTFDGCPPCGLAHRLQVPPASMA
jgi:hypothetical protein